MRAERQREILREIFSLADHDTTQLADAPMTSPVGQYLSPAVHEAERDQLFHARPVLACLTPDLPNPGDCYATTSADVTFFAVRQPDLSVRAFANVCRHRGSPLLPPGVSHVARSLHCGFHGWTYDLEGALVGRPHSVDGFRDLEDACYGLVALPAAEAHGLVFVRPKGTTPIDTSQLLGAMGDELADFGFAGYHRFDEWVSEWSANWKLLVETFLETYHVPTLHPKTVGRHFLSRPSVWKPFGPNLRFHSLMKSVLAQRDQPEADWDLLAHSTVEFFIAPNAVLNYSVDHLAVYRFLPLAANNTRVNMTVYTPARVASEEERIHFTRTIELHQRVSGGEDFPKQVEVQRALAGGSVPHVVFGRNEPAAIHFHRSLAAIIEGKASDGDDPRAL